LKQQGSIPIKDDAELGIEDTKVDNLRVGNKLNLLKAGLLGASAVAAPSSTYGERFYDETHAGAMARQLTESNIDVLGILGGIDFAQDNPATDPNLVGRYDAEAPANKGRNKTALIREVGLELELRRPLLAVLGPFDKLHSGELIAGCLGAIAKNDVSVVVGGTGPDPVLKRFREEASRRPETVAVIEAVDARLRHLLLAGADLVLSAPHQEPTGVTLMRAHRYGTLPVASAVDAALECVVDCDAQLETGTGFLFDAFNQRSLVAALQRGLSAYVHPRWPDLVRRVMRQDLSWDRAARRYLQVYRHVLSSMPA
jgi:starch synthase